jgi:hypothetical protein
MRYPQAGYLSGACAGAGILANLTDAALRHLDYDPPFVI